MDNSLINGTEVVSALADTFRGEGLTRYSKDKAERKNNTTKNERQDFVTCSLKTFYSA